MLKQLLHFHFRCLYTLRDRLGKRLTQGGFLVLGGLIVSAALGIDTNRTMAYQIAAFLFSLLVFSVLSRLFQERIAHRGRRRDAILYSIRRILPRFGTAGTPLAYRMVIRNHTGTVQDGLYLLENLTDPCPSFEEFIQNPEPQEAARNWFDRRVGYYRWKWLISRKQGAMVKEHPLPPLPPDEEVEIQLEITPLRRGRLHFTGVVLARPDLFGLSRSLVTVPADQSVLILPRRYPLPPLEPGKSRRFQQGGVRLASKVGDSEEFMSLREYRSGDPLHRIHWKSWARVGKPVIKEYLEEFFVRHALILDTFLQTDYSEAFEEAVSLAASFVCRFEAEESLLDLLLVGTEAHCFTSGRGITHQDRMMEILASVRVCKDKPFSALHHLPAERIASLSGCVCILLSWDEQRQALIRDLKRCGIPVLVLLVTDRNASPPSDPGPMQDTPKLFRSLEAGKVAEGLTGL